MKATKRPITIDVWQFKNTIEGAPGWLAGPIDASTVRPSVGENGFELVIATLEGEHHCRNGAWIAKGVRGELYVIQDEILRETYDLAED